MSDHLSSFYRRKAKEEQDACVERATVEESNVRTGLLDEQALAHLLCISKKTVQNIYSKTPHRLPAAIHIPGARGPRWTEKALSDWIDGRPAHTQKPVPPREKKRVGRPRIADTMGLRNKS